MKKLYAKASFKSKKLTKGGKQEVAGDPNAAIIFAYQSSDTSSNLSNGSNTLPHPVRQHNSNNGDKQQKGFKANETLRPAPPPPPIASTSSAAATNSATAAPAATRPFARTPQSDEAHYYYSIQELQQLNMLDHRHPYFHRQQQQQQQQLLRHANSSAATMTPPTSPAPSGLPIYEHHRLVLQLPMAANDATPTKTPCTSPIYEAPQMVGSNSNNNNGAMHLLSPLSAVSHTNGIADGAHSLDYQHQQQHQDSISSGCFGSLPIVDVVDGATTLPFNKLRKLQHTHSLPSIRMSNSQRPHSADGGGGRAGDGDGYDDNVDDDDDEGGFNQQPPHWHHQQQQLHQLPRHNSASATQFMFVGGSPGPASNFYAEQSIIGARASVMVYDDNQKRWLPSGTSSGLSKVQIYHHQQNNTFRIVGRKLQDHEVVINCSILKGLKYNQATPTFHQWRDSKFVYGLNFSSQSDAEAFARAMVHALDVLSGRVANNPVIGAIGVGGQPTNGNGYEEDMGYRTMTSEDAAILRQQQQITGQITPSAQTPTSQTNQNNIPQSPPTPQGHHRTSRNSLSAPAATQPQQMTIPQQQTQPSSYGQPITQNGLQQQQQPQIPPAPGQTQYHTPQPMQPQQQVVHPVYATQQHVNAGYQQQNQYQPTTHFMLSNSNPNLNLHQYSQSQQQCIPIAPQPPIPPPHQNGIGGGGPIYVSSSQSQPVLPTSSSSNNVIYGSQQQQLQQQQQMQQPSQAPQPPPQPPAIGGIQNGIVVGAAPPPPPPPPYGHASNMMAAPPAPIPPSANRSAPQAPAAPPPPPSFGSAPPPPPPPPSAGGSAAAKKEDPQAELMGSLAAQLQQAKLRKNKTSTAPPENSGSSTSSGGSNYGTIGRSSTGMASMMDEMAKTLARRRAQAEKKEPDPEPDVKQRPWEKSNTLPHKLGSSASNTNCNANSNNTSNSGGESPRPIRKRFGSASEETILKQVNGDGLSLALSSTDLDTLKAEMLREIRAEIQKLKSEIIDVIKSEFNRR